MAEDIECYIPQTDLDVKPLLVLFFSWYEKSVQLNMLLEVLTALAICCYVQNTTHLASNNTHLLSHSFCGSGVWVHFALFSARLHSRCCPGMGLIWLFHWEEVHSNQVFGRTHFLVVAGRGVPIFSLSVPCHLGLLSSKPSEQRVSSHGVCYHLI